MSLKSIFKRKEGGTVLGNVIRGVLNTATKGVLGNGALQLKPGQTKEENQLNMVKAAAAANVTFQNVTGKTEPPPSKTDKITNAIKEGTILGYLQKYWYLAAIAVGGAIYGIYKLIK